MHKLNHAYAYACMQSCIKFKRHWTTFRHLFTEAYQHRQNLQILGQEHKKSKLAAMDNNHPKNNNPNS